MNTTLSQQIEAIQKARNIVEEYFHCAILVDVAQITPITDALNDAGSTIAAINLNPYMKDFETYLSNQKFREELLHKKITELENRLQFYANQNQNQ